MIRVGREEAEDVPTRVTLSPRDGDAFKEALSRAVNGRVIAATTETDGVTLTWTDESIVKAWPMLRQWINDDREFLLWRQRICENLR